MNFISSDSDGNFSFDFPTAKLSEIEYEGEFTVYVVDKDGYELSKTYTYASVETGEVSYCNENGGEIAKDNLSSFSGKKVIVKIPVINRTKTDFTPAFAITGSENGKIKNVGISQNTGLSAQSTQVISCEIIYDSTLTYEYMIWDDFGVMKPLTKKATIE